MPDTTTIEQRLADLAEAGLLGEAAKDFLSSDLGKRVMQLVEEDSQEAMQKLVNTDPNDPAAIRELQNEIKRAHTFGVYLAELITRGEQAQEVWKHEQRQTD